MRFMSRIAATAHGRDGAGVLALLKQPGALAEHANLPSGRIEATYVQDPVAVSASLRT
jgi:hypothetical protein